MANQEKKTFDYYEYMKAYRKNNPDKVQKWKTTAYANALRRLGYTVIAPDGSTQHQEG